MLGYSGDNKIKLFSLLFLAPRSFLYSFSLFPFFFLSSPISSTPYIRNNIRTNPHWLGWNTLSSPPNSRSPVTINLPFSLPSSRYFASLSLYPVLPFPPPSSCAARARALLPPPSVLSLFSPSQLPAGIGLPTPSGSQQVATAQKPPTPHPKPSIRDPFKFINSTPGSAWDCGNLSTLLNTYIPCHWQRKRVAWGQVSFQFIHYFGALFHIQPSHILFTVKRSISS